MIVSDRAPAVRLSCPVKTRAVLLVCMLLSSLNGAAALAPKPAKSHRAQPHRAEIALRRRLGRLLRARRGDRGFWGIYVYSLSRHRVLYAHNGEHWFTPASNAKLFTLAAALHLLGAGYRFHTDVDASAGPNPAGVIEGDIVLMGAGDPSLSGRSYPYRYVPTRPGAPPVLPFDPDAAAAGLARQLAARGITRITGDVVGDDTYYADDPYPPGWADDDLVQGYGAPVSALTMNDNERFLEVQPAAAVGAAARLRFDPAVGAPPVENRVLTSAPGTYADVRLAADPLTGGVRVSGSVPLGGGDIEEVAVRDPAVYAAQLLRRALLAQGIAVAGQARARHRPHGGAAAPLPAYRLAEWVSPPLAQILQTTAKLSQNLEAELMLRLLGKLRGPAAEANLEQDGSRRSGELVVKAFLHQAGLGEGDAELVDGSGLSRLDLVTPAGVVRLLRYMADQPEAAIWEGILPVAAVDGTLARRFHGTAAAGRLHAKTGSLTHVSCLSGYVTTPGGDRRVFALMADNQGRPVLSWLNLMAEAIARR